MSKVCSEGRRNCMRWKTVTTIRSFPVLMHTAMKIASFMQCALTAGIRARWRCVVRWRAPVCLTTMDLIRSRYHTHYPYWCVLYTLLWTKMIPPKCMCVLLKFDDDGMGMVVE